MMFISIMLVAVVSENENGNTKNNENIEATNTKTSG